MKRLGWIMLAGTVILTGTAGAQGREPDSFHWTMKPNSPNIRSYEFDINHGHWTATLTRGDTMVTEEGNLSETEGSEFYHGLETAGVWRVQSSAVPAPDRPHYVYLVTRKRDQHEAEFSGSPGPDYDRLLKFLGDGLVGHEAQALMDKVSHH